MNLHIMSLAGLLAVAQAAHADFSFPYTKSSSSTPATDALVLEYKQAIEQLDMAKVQELLATKFPTNQTQLNHIIAIAHITAEHYRQAQDSYVLALKDTLINIANPAIMLFGGAVGLWGINRWGTLRQEAQKAAKSGMMGKLAGAARSTLMSFEAVGNEVYQTNLEELQKENAPVYKIWNYKAQYQVDESAKVLREKLNKPVRGYHVQWAAGVSLVALGYALSHCSNKLQRIARYQRAQEIYELLAKVS